MTTENPSGAGETPPLTATAVLHGETATVTIGGHTETVSGADETATRRNVMALVVDHARTAQQPVALGTTDDSGEAAFRVSPEGAIAPAEVEQPAPTTRRELRTARDFSSTKKATPTGPAAMGFRGWLNGLGMHLAPTALELAWRDDRATIQRGLLGHKTVAFFNLKGGATKTTCTYLVAATLGRIRGGNILSWDNNENKGTMGDRSTRANHDHTAIDLLEHIDDFRTPENAPHLINYVRPQGENKFAVLASQDEGSTRPVIGGEEFSKLHKALRQFYHLILVDTGNASNASNWLAAAEECDEMVIVAKNKEDDAKLAAATIDALVAQGHVDKLRNSVGIITLTQEPTDRGARKKNAERLDRMKDHWGSYLREVIIAPFDTSLDDGDEVVYERLSDETKEAFVKASAAITRGL